jgi:hypothetical protein
MRRAHNAAHMHADVLDVCRAASDLPITGLGCRPEETEQHK